MHARQAQRLQQVEQAVLVDVVLEVVKQRAAAHGQHGEVGQGEDEHGDPRTILEQSAEIPLGVRFLFRIRQDSLAGSQERDHEQDHADNGPQPHGHLPALGFVALSELSHQGQGETYHNQLRDHGRDESVGRQEGALVDVARHDTAQRRVRRVVGGVQRHQQNIGQTGIDQAAGHPEARIRIGQDHGEAPRDGSPKHPWAELSPSCLGAVRHHPHHGIEECIPKTTHQQ